MIDNNFDLNLIRLFVTMVESPTLTAAAERSGMTRSNASRRLKILEERMGAQLMRRTTRNVELTEAGHLLYSHALRMLDELQSAGMSIDSLGKVVRGDVRVRLPTGLGHLYLTPLLLEFARSHPQISLRVAINDNIGDLISAEIDVALKITSQPPEDHVARRICEVGWCLCASSAFLDAHGPIRSVEDLERCDFITPQSLGRRFNLKVWLAGTPQTLRVSPRIQSGDYPFLFESMMADLGVALLPRYAVWRQIQSGVAREVLDECEAEGVGDSIYMLTAPNRYPTLATRTLMDFIRSHLERQAENWQRRNPAAVSTLNRPS
ncbi:LysR family transcriptional regulator [Cupriavidus sp. TA19]|uniref:LysR family transcriptional regulator n=1 Tax=unclassified Cupriavidus TaxID=2640874 RepID=UPI000E2FF2CC|nr:MULTISPECIES: LysR family transcriptional regulator [unclassified Cupriavidus]BDB30653.1 LysR family transcriptional regulator [Cupriavidus sp. P-10]GLC95707.1 LysR family transcriptional regulator [Cupriavidus sp. TA19]